MRGGDCDPPQMLQRFSDRPEDWQCSIKADDLQDATDEWGRARDEHLHAPRLRALLGGGEHPQPPPIDVSQLTHVDDDVPTVPDDRLQRIAQRGERAGIHLAANAQDISFRDNLNVARENIHLTPKHRGRYVKAGSRNGGHQAGVKTPERTLPRARTHDRNGWTYGSAVSVSGDDAGGHSPCRIPPAPKGGQEDLDVAVQTPPRSVGVRHLPGMGWRQLERGAGPWIWYHLIGRGGTVITVPKTLIDAIEESRLRHGQREDGKFLLAFVEIYEVLDFTEREPDRQADGQT